MSRVRPEELAARAEVLREAMRRKGWGVVELADAAGVAHSHVSRITSGKVSGSAMVLSDIAAALGISLDLLLKREVRPSPASIAETTESERGAA